MIFFCQVRFNCVVRHSVRWCRVPEVPLLFPSLPPSVPRSFAPSKTTMTMTKNNSVAAAEAAPPNCHVALVPPSNCAVDGRGRTWMDGQEPSDSPNISDISPFLDIVAPKRSQSLSLSLSLSLHTSSCHKISRGHAVKCSQSRASTDHPLLPPPPSFSPATTNPFPEGKK